MDLVDDVASAVAVGIEENDGVVMWRFRSRQIPHLLRPAVWIRVRCIVWAEPVEITRRAVGGEVVPPDLGELNVHFFGVG